MPTVLFWNLKQRPLGSLVGRLARSIGADIVVLAEADPDIAQTLAGLNADGDSIFLLDSFPLGSLKFFSRFRPEQVLPFGDGFGFSIRQYAPPLGAPFIVVAVHFPSKRYRDDADYTLICSTMVRAIEEVEGKVGHSRTIVIGDFNMNPFEDGLAAAGGLHAVMDRRIAAKEARKVLGSQYRFFYNPMWGRLRDFHGRPAGTYYWDSGRAQNHYWHMLDQVLLRPSLLPVFDDDGIEIITDIAGISLLDAHGRPDQDRASDHLPIVVRLHHIEERLS